MAPRIIVHPRSNWTSQPARPSIGTDGGNGINVFRPNQVKGIHFVSDPTDEVLQNKDPAVCIRRLFHHDFIDMAHGDITINLAVSGGVRGVWNLRGLANKSAYSSNSDDNLSYVSVYVFLGNRELPTDVLVRNIVDARRLVLSRFPEATGVISDGNNPYLTELIKNLGELPVGDYEPEFVNPLPPFPINPGRHDVHVQNLQDQLAYWGYYRVRCDGHYGPLTQAAVVELQADLADLGYYYKNFDGLYGSYTHQGWLRFLKTLW